MTARVLVVDDIPANVKLLEARLVAEYFDVITAEDGFKALAICDDEQVDIILLDIMMPGMDGFEVCEKLKSNPKTAHIPVVMVTALDQPSDRVRGLKAGADDFLTKPVNDLQLIARVKSLVRLKAVSDELRLRAETARQIGIEEMLRSDGLMQTPARAGGGWPRQLAGADRPALKPIADVDAVTEPQSALLKAASNPFELVIVNSNFEITIRCGCARSYVRWSAPASCHCFWWRSRGG